MTMTIQDELLAKAAHNVDRVREFFVARRGWRVSADATPALVRLHEALRTCLGSALRPLLERNGLTIFCASPAVAGPELPEAELEADRVERFAAFMRQLNDWFSSQGDTSASTQGREVLESVVAAVVGTTEAVEAILAASRVEVEPAGPARQRVGAPDPPAPDSLSDPLEQLPMSSALRAEEAESLAEPPLPDRPDLRLVLEDTEQNPVLQTFKGAIELSYEAKEAIGGFLAEVGIEYRAYQLDKFLRKVQGWVEATPPGTVLVIRIGTLSGQYEPYPSYVIKERQI